MAEILSRYFPKDVEMHSFDTGTALSKKKDNWALIEKFLKVQLPSHKLYWGHTLSCYHFKMLYPVLQAHIREHHILFSAQLL